MRPIWRRPHLPPTCKRPKPWQPGITCDTRRRNRRLHGTLCCNLPYARPRNRAHATYRQLLIVLPPRRPRPRNLRRMQANAPRQSRSERNDHRLAKIPLKTDLHRKSALLAGRLIRLACRGLKTFGVTPIFLQYELTSWITREQGASPKPCGAMGEE